MNARLKWTEGWQNMDDEGNRRLVTKRYTGRGTGYQNVSTCFTVRQVLDMIAADPEARKVLYEVTDVQRGLEALEIQGARKRLAKEAS